ncbi:Rhomboid family protein [Saccharopolyspora antimicrobica]|uniref:Rhomboid family protein n=2 Tax=Saccharopolyspora antimicrobica TaxID=455193 RepID=A0A1I5I087_9PSEU|nr:rhomboid family protein [Saccharopolyspora antimicrobica]SFO53927.1 Rhomboid family protein [Saccharopolyspora antimicrobica]
MLPANPLRAAVGMLIATAALYGIEFYDQVNPAARLDDNGILPRDVSGLDGILWAPLLHVDWAHLWANTLPFLVLGWLVLAGGVGQFIAVTATVWVIGGVGTWVVGAPAYHIGMSGVIFGWMVFLLVRGFFQRSVAQILVAVALFFYWGGMLWGVLPGKEGISWEGHLFGALGGLLAAWLVARSTRRQVASSGPGTLAG